MYSGWQIFAEGSWTLLLGHTSASAEGLSQDVFLACRYKATMFTRYLPKRRFLPSGGGFAGLVGSGGGVGGFNVALFRALVMEYHSHHLRTRRKGLLGT